MKLLRTDLVKIGIFAKENYPVRLDTKIVEAPKNSYVTRVPVYSGNTFGIQLVDDVKLDTITDSRTRFNIGFSMSANTLVYSEVD